MSSVDNIYMLNHIDSFDKEDKLMLKNGKHTIVFNFADWCPYCQNTKPVFQKLADKMSSKMNFATVNYSRDISEDEKQLGQKVSKTFDVNAFPTFLIFNAKGEFVERINGAQKESMLASEIRKYT